MSSARGGSPTRHDMNTTGYGQESDALHLKALPDDRKNSMGFDRISRPILKVPSVMMLGPQRPCQTLPRHDWYMGQTFNLFLTVPLPLAFATVPKPQAISQDVHTSSQCRDGLMKSRKSNHGIRVD